MDTEMATATKQVNDASISCILIILPLIIIGDDVGAMVVVGIMVIVEEPCIILKI